MFFSDMWNKEFIQNHKSEKLFEDWKTKSSGYQNVLLNSAI